jgi:hypothetical protein
MEMHGERREVLLVLLKMFENLFDCPRQIVACHLTVEHELVVEVTA